MEASKINRLAIVFGVVGLVALVAAGGLVLHGRPVLLDPVIAAGTARGPEGGHEGHAHEPEGEKHRQGGEAHAEQKAQGAEAHSQHDGDGHGEEKATDLDKPAEELWAAKCEHGIPAHECDECRFEVGMVKLSPSLFGEEGKPGLVKAMQAGSRSFSETLALTGEVHLSEGKTVHVSSPLPGRISRVSAGIGSRVSAGDVLFQVDSHEVGDAKADYLKLIAGLNLARKTADREKLLFEKKISAASEVQEAEARRAEAEVAVANAKAKLLRMGVPAAAVTALADGSSSDLSGVLSIRAPRAGVVLEKHAVEGEHVEPGKDVLLLSDLSEVWVWANLKETDLQAITKAGGRLAAEVEAPGSGRTYRGIVDIVSGTMDEKTRTARARVVLANTGGGLKPGMFVKIRLLIRGPGKGSVAVPKVAVLADEGRTFVFVHKQGDYWLRRPVALGERFGDQVEIREGLKAGQTIVADGSFLLKSDVLRSKMGAGCAD